MASDWLDLPVVIDFYGAYREVTRPDEALAILKKWPTSHEIGHAIQAVQTALSDPDSASARMAARMAFAAAAKEAGLLVEVG